MDINLVCIGGIRSKTQASPCVIFCVFLQQAPSAERQSWLQPPASAQPWDSDPPVGSAAITKSYITQNHSSFFTLHSFLSLNLPSPEIIMSSPSSLHLTLFPYFFLYLSTSYTEKWSCLILSVCFCLLGIFVTYVFTIYMIYFTFILSPFISFFSCSCILLCFCYSNLL